MSDTLSAGAERVTRRPLEDGDWFVVGHTVLVYRADGGEAGDVDGIPSAPAPGLATMSSNLGAELRKLVDAARSSTAIAITGESGTGKELIARAVHTLSGRTGAFVAVNCGEYRDSPIEPALFGHKKGAFTGALDDRPGLVRSADGGTLFLDEIAELKPDSQAALLRVLQEREVVPVGGDRPVKVDFRLVTATHKNLEAEAGAGRFRADLRSRTLGVPVALPPLRSRREDLGLLVATLLERLAPGRDVTFAADVLGALYAHDWPLNVRELERTLQGALAVAQDRIEIQHLPDAVVDNEPIDASALKSLTAEDQQLRDQLVAAIARHNGNLAGVARDLGKDRTQIRRWMKRFGITRDVTG